MAHQPDRAKSPVETVKEQSDHLRGQLAAELADATTTHISKDSTLLIKFHGSYQQEDRDARKTRTVPGAGKFYMFMVRCKIPGGKLTGEQYLALDRLADQYANGTLRLTSRQSVQFHGVLKRHLADNIRGINDALLTTLGACGDVNRNVMCCPAPLRQDGLREALQAEADRLAAHFTPRTGAYHAIWLNGHPVRFDRDTIVVEEGGRCGGPAPVGDGDAVEPLYGSTYLPRKFKMGLTLPEDNCIDIFAQDLGLVAEHAGGQILGWNVLVGGGMGMTHGKPDTFPYLAQPICWVPADAAIRIAEAVVRLYRDHGNRGDRKRARIKYLVADWGVTAFRERLEDYWGGTLALPKPIEVLDGDLHLGWQAQGDGKFFFGVSIPSGRIKDTADSRLRTALRRLVQATAATVRLTAHQDLLLCDLPASARDLIEETLTAHGVALPHQMRPLRLYSLACPAIPTCGLAISESERALPIVLNQLEQLLERLGLAEERLAIRSTGCPNGCARPYQSDIGIVGRSGEKYLLLVGGRIRGDRLNEPLRDLVPLNAIVPTLEPLFTAFRQERAPGEAFGEWCARRGTPALRSLLPPEPDRRGDLEDVA